MRPAASWLFGLLGALALAPLRAQETARTVTPVPSPETRAAAAGWRNGDWQRQHADGCALAAHGCDLLLLGDSITQGFGGDGRDVASSGDAARQRHLGAYRTANLGISGDRTQHVLWRLQHGGVDGFDPRFVVFTIGINNLVAGDAPTEVAAGVDACVRELAARLPHATIVVCGALPAGRTQGDALRAGTRELHTLLRAAPPRPNVVVADLTEVFVADDGSLRPGLLGDDALHLLAKGYDAWAAALAARLAELGKTRPPHVVFVAGDDEYRSEESLPMLAAILPRLLPCRTSVCLPKDQDGRVDPLAKDHIDGLQALDSADAMVLFTRFRRLPEVEFARIERHLLRGRAAVGLRTATHAFRYDEPEFERRNEDWPRAVWGQHWITHHGHFDDGNELLTDVAPVASEHPVLRGVRPFAAYSWLYHVQGGGNELYRVRDVLVNGTARRSNLPDVARHPRTQPVAWTRLQQLPDGGEQRIFFTTLGHPFDFRDESMRRLVLQGLLWTLHRDADIPAAGVDVAFAAPYDPPNSGEGKHRR